MEKMESALDVLSRAATMVQPCPAYPASDSEGFETPSTASSGESEGDRTLSPEAPRSSQPKELTGKWKRERRSIRLPDYKPRDGKMALRSQSFNERRPAPAVARAPHSDGEDADSGDDGHNGNAECKSEAPIDMRLGARAPPPYRPSVITKSDANNSMSVCDPIIDEHFRRSLGDDYMNLLKKNSIPDEAQPGPKPNTKDRASSPIQFLNEESPPPPPKPAKTIAMDVDDASLSVDDHFAKALGDTWKKIQTSRTQEQTPSKVVDDHFSKALGDTWNKIQATKPSPDNTKPKSQTTKIITRSGVVI